MLNADGTDLVYGSYFGGADDDFASVVAIDPTGKVWLGGGTSSADFPVTPDADQSTPLGDSNAWIARLDPGSAAAALRSDRLGRREQGTAAFYLSLMPAARLGALAIITAATGIGDFQLLAALVNFFPNSERESILVLLTATGGQSLEFPPVEGRVNAVTASEQGAVVVAETNGQNSNAMLSTITVEQTEGGTNLDISKTADPEKVATGAEVLYTIKVFNRGPEEAENVVVIDTLPSNSAVIGDLPDKCIGKGPQVICDLGTVPVGGVGVSRVFEVRAPAQPGTMVNTARIEGSGSAEAQTVVEEGLDVQIELTGLDDLLNGQEVVFKLKITNHGPPLATDVNVVFPVQPPIELQDPFYSSDRARGTCERKDTNPFALLRPTEVRCELAELAAGENWNIDVMGRAGPLEALASYEAEVGSREADTNRSNNSPSNTLIVRGNSAADVAVVPVSLSIGPSGGHHTVKVNVKNFGVSSATNVQLTVEAGSGVDLSELGTEAYRNGSFGGCGDSGTCKLSFGDIGALDTVTSLLTFDSSAKNISIVFRVSANEPDPNPTNNQILYEEPLPKVLTRAALGDGSQHGKQQILEPPSPILPPPAAVTNSAAGNNFDTVSAGSGHTVWGTGFSSNVRVADGSERMPIDLDGVKVRLNGIPAPLFFVAPNQINFQTPWELLRDRLAEVRVEVHAATTMPFFVRVAIHDPGIFTTNQSGSGQGAILIANSASLAAPAGMFPGSQPVARGGFVSIFCNGLGPVSDPPPTGAGAWTDRLASTQTLPVVTVDGLDAPVFFSGLAPGFVGLYQVNAQIPEGASTGDAVDLSVTIGGIESNGVTIAISE